MNLLFAGPLPPFEGGAAFVNRDLIAGLARRGHRVRAVAPVMAKDLSLAEAFARAHPNISFRWFQQPRYVLISGPADEIRDAVSAEARQFADTLSAEMAHEPDIVICGRESAAVALTQVEAAASVPAVVIAHGKGFVDAANGDWPPPLQDRIVSAYHRCGRVILVARHLQRWLGALRLPHATVIGNAADHRLFFPAPKDPELMRRWQIQPDDLVVAHLSNLGPIKRPFDIVKAAGRALAREPRLLFLIVGNDRLRGEMEEACVGAGIAGRFRFAGWVDQSESPRYLNLADMVVMPSQLEALSLVYLEAQACGRVLIASDIPAAREVIEDGVTGLLFPMGVIEAFSERILLAAAQPGLRAAIGRRARAQAEASGMDEWLDAYERALRELVPGARAA